MGTRPDRTELRDRARRRLREQPSARPTQATRPRGNASIDERDLQRSLEKLDALVGR
jgi:hypothetical protein